MSSLKDFIDNTMIEFHRDDSLFRNIPRHLIAFYSKMGMRELEATISENLYGYNFIVPHTCRVEKPEGFESFVRAYVVSCDDKIIEISNNKTLPKQIYNFLHDCDGSILGDKCSGELLTNCFYCNNEPECNKCIARCGCEDDCGFTADIIKYKDSWVREDGNKIIFSDDLEGMAMVVEYISNNLKTKAECDIAVPPEIEQALWYFVRFKLAETGQDMMNVMRIYKDEWQKKKKILKNGKYNLTINDIYLFVAQSKSFI